MNRRQRILFRMVRRLHPPREDEQMLALARDTLARLTPVEVKLLTSKTFKKLMKQASQLYARAFKDVLESINPFYELGKKMVEEFGVKKSQGTAADRFWLREASERGTTGVGGAESVGSRFVGHPSTPTTLDRYGSGCAGRSRRPADQPRAVRVRHRPQARGGGR